MPLGLGREPQVRCHAEWHAWECQMLWEMVHIYGLLSASGKSKRSVLSVVLHTRKQTQRDKHSEELMHPSSSRARIETQVLLCAAIPLRPSLCCSQEPVRMRHGSMKQTYQGQRGGGFRVG